MNEMKHGGFSYVEELVVVKAVILRRFTKQEVGKLIDLALLR